MAQTLLIVAGGDGVVETMMEPFCARGWEIRHAAPTDETLLDLIATTKPLAAVFSMDSCGVQELSEVARSVLGDTRLLRPLMVFTGGSPADVARLKAEVPVGVFVREDELPWVLKHLSVKF